MAGLHDLLLIFLLVGSLVRCPVPPVSSLDGLHRFQLTGKQPAERLMDPGIIVPAEASAPVQFSCLCT